MINNSCTVYYNGETRFLTAILLNMCITKPPQGGFVMHHWSAAVRLLNTNY